MKLNDYLPGIIATTGLNEITACGNVDILKQPKAAIFNSRQGKTPDSASEWVRTTLNLTEEIVKTGTTIISSIGMVTWELVSWKTAVDDGNLILLITEIDGDIIPGMTDKIVEDFQFDKNKVLFLFPDPETKPDRKYRKFPHKDFWIAAIANRIYPISVRPQGNHSRLIELFSIIPGKVEPKFQIEYAKPSAASFHPSQLPDLKVREEFEWEYLTHYTRSSISPYPDESKADFYKSIVEGESGYSHSGYNTLCRILRNMKILGTDKLIRGGFEVISLTECAPSEMKGLMKYRPALQRWTFEPYGIAVRKDVLTDARKVIYGFDYQYRFLQGDDRAYFQAVNDDEKSWRAEKEWRIIGNLDLKQFQPEDVIVIVPSFEEAEDLSEWSPFPVKYWDEFGIPEEEEQ